MYWSLCFGVWGEDISRHIKVFVWGFCLLKEDDQETATPLRWCSLPWKSYKFLILPPRKPSNIKWMQKGRGGQHIMRFSNNLEEIKYLYLSKPQHSTHSHFHLTLNTSEKCWHVHTQTRLQCTYTRILNAFPRHTHPFSKKIFSWECQRNSETRRTELIHRNKQKGSLVLRNSIRKDVINLDITQILKGRPLNCSLCFLQKVQEKNLICRAKILKYIFCYDREINCVSSLSFLYRMPF